MAEKLYPARQRCKTCGKGFTEFGALDGLYCSYKCGGFTTPFKSVNDAPRWCKTQKGGKWVWKKRLRALSELPKVLRDDPTTSTYWCDHCHFIHVGGSESKNLTFSKKDKLISDPEDIAEILIKSRGEATIRDIARKTGLQAIRIKELEQPKKGQKVELETLFALLRFYRLKASVIFRD